MILNLSLSIKIKKKGKEICGGKETASENSLATASEYICIYPPHPIPQ